MINPSHVLDFVERGSLREMIISLDLYERVNFAAQLRELLTSQNKYARIRVGCDGDGGYLIPPMKFDKIVSIGVGREMSFEFDERLADSEIFLFDHTINCPDNLSNNMKFYKKGLGEANSKELFDFETILKNTDLSHTHSNLIKIDIEGDEYSALKNADFSNFTVLIIEFHFLEKIFFSRKFEEFRVLISKLSREHQVFHVHANNWSKLFNIGPEVLPDVVEITFVRKDVWSKLEESGNRDRDFSCRRGYPEIWPISS
jgi:hypothetical protein